MYIFQMNIYNKRYYIIKDIYDTEISELYLLFYLLNLYIP